MRKEYKKFLKKAFTEYITNKWENVKLTKPNGLILCEAWETSLPKHNLFVALEIHQSSEEFGIVIGWNSEIRQPDILEVCMDDRYLDFHGQSVELDLNCISLKLLADGDDSKWEIFDLDSLVEDPSILVKPLSEEVIDNDVMPVFNEAIRVFEAVGLPFLERSVKCYKKINPQANH